MMREERQGLREAAECAARARRESTRNPAWELQTSNSFRRIGMCGDGDILCAITHPRDRHPDLLAPPGVLEYVVAAQPRVILALLDYIDKIEQGALAVVEAQLAEIVRMQQALELIAVGKRNDGTYNRSREACEKLAKAALAKEPR